MKIVTAEQMRRIETACVEAGVSLDQLMENAGLAVARAVRDELPDPRNANILVLVGPGNNGGDGLVAARHLASWGARVTACACAVRPEPDPKRILAEDAGVAVISANDDSGLAQIGELAAGAHVVVDAVLGTGRLRPIQPPLSDVLALVRDAAESTHAPIMAVDLPTGTDADTGRFDPSGLPADATFVLGLPKIGPYLRPGESRCGQLRVLDIGIPPGLDEDILIELLTLETASALMPDRAPDAHKGTFGRALIVAGSLNYVGAAYLAAAAATRSGPGLVTLATPRSVHALVAPSLADATYLPLAETSDGLIDAPHALHDVRPLLSQSTSLLVGPGLGQTPEIRDLVVGLLLYGSDHPAAVLDADALNILARAEGWWDRIRGPAILTPHPGEMARLLAIDSVADVLENRVAVAQDAARHWAHVVVLKGACTVIAHPDGRTRISPWANSGLARGGTGDVLSGIIAGLLAQRPEAPFDAAALGVYVHGLAAEIVRDEFGETAMTASDLLPALPDAFLQLEAPTLADASLELDDDDPDRENPPL